MPLHFRIEQVALMHACSFWLACYKWHSCILQFHIQGSVSTLQVLYPPSRPKTRPWRVGWTNVSTCICSSNPVIDVFEKALKSVTFQSPSFFFLINAYAYTRIYAFYW